MTGSCVAASGKPFFWCAKQSRGLATSEVQISETETSLHRLETVYRRLVGFRQFSLVAKSSLI